jgi:hypothetical protein
MPEINWIAAVVAGIAGFFVGGLWYSPVLFGKPWSAATGVDSTKPGGYSPAVTFGVGTVMSVVAAIVFAFFIGAKPALDFAVYAGLAVGIGWVATSFFINGFFERKPVSLLLINSGFHTVQFAIFGLILGLWH